MSATASSPKEVTVTFLGDIMLGRLIDQLLPTHVDEPEERELASHFRSRHAQLQNYSYLTPWGNSLPLLRRSDVVLGNLETSVTTHNIKWPDKVFNYRMHPDNVKCLREAGIDYVSLANNHTLDFSKQGLLDTVRTLKTSGIAFAGAGETKEEAERPAQFRLRPHSDDDLAWQVQVHSFSDHPSDWAGVDLFNHLEYSTAFKEKLRRLLTTQEQSQPSLKVFSVHWGPNYRWQPDSEIRDMAHFLIDSCGIDVVWGHSSHHIQGVEIYREKLIIYGCGDFVDDYAVNQEYRNDLSAAWTLKLELNGTSLQLRELEVRPNRIKHFQASLLDGTDEDHKWVRAKFTDLCNELGTKVDPQLGSEGQILIKLAPHQKE